MAKEAVKVSITGTRQARTIGDAYNAKVASDTAKSNYDTSRAGAVGIMLTKVLGFWRKQGNPVMGKYDFIMPDGTVHTGNVQNRQSSKSFTPQKAKEVVEKIAAGAKEGHTIKASDVLDVKTTHALHPDVMAKPRIRKRLLEVLSGVELQLREEGVLPPELNLVDETKELVIAEHAMDRLIVTHNDLNEAMELLKNPITVNFVTDTE
jgi:hypothetical protein